MEVPKVLREQIKYCERHGFKAKHIEPRKGSHWKVEFEGVPQPMFMSCCAAEYRSLKNTLSRLRRFASGKGPNLVGLH